MRSIWITGFSAVGKTTVGNVLAKIIKRRFVDIDQEIVWSTHLSIPDLIAQKGMGEFRRIEKEHVVKFAALPDLVVSLGGGAFSDPESRAVILESTYCVYLSASFEFFQERLTTAVLSTRPLLKNRSLEDTRALYWERHPHYAQAHSEVRVEGKSPEDIAREIADQYEQESEQ